MTRLPSPALFLLAARRTLPPLLVIAFVPVLLLAARSPSLPQVLASDPETEVVSGRLARLDVWSVFWILGAPALLWQAARLGSRWRERDADWLAPAPVPRLALALATAAGAVAAGIGLAGLTALVAEGAAGAGPPALRWRRSLSNPPAFLLEDRPAVRWEASALAGAPPGARLRLPVTVAPGAGPAVTASLRALAGEVTLASVERRVSGRTALELVLPPADGHSGSAPRQSAPVALELARIGPGSVLVLPPDELELLVPASSERWISAGLLARAALSLAAGLPLALGLACWMRPVLAALCVFSCALAGCSPAGDLGRVWSLAGAGIVPGPVRPGALLVSFLLALLGIALHHRAIVRGRTPG